MDGQGERVHPLYEYTRRVLLGICCHRLIERKGRGAGLCRLAIKTESHPRQVGGLPT